MAMGISRRQSGAVRVLAGGTLVELSGRRVRRADLVIEGGLITAVVEAGTAQSVGAQVSSVPEAAEVIDCRGCLVMPGLVVGHTHLYSALAVGMPPPALAPSSFPEILERVWWKLDRALDDDTVALSALAGAAAAARAGVTTLFDHHASPQAIAGSLDRVGSACETVGIRGVLCYEVSDRGGLAEAKRGLAENDRFLSLLARDTAGPYTASHPPGHPLLRGLVGAHAGFTIGHDTAVALADLATRHQTGVHIHVAEDACDARHVVPAREVSIVEWLDSYRLLAPRSLLAHAVHVDDAGAQRIAESGAFVAHNPRSNMNNAVGYARPSRFGEEVVLGTDGIGADLFAEAQAAFFAAREHHHAFDPLAALARAQSMAAASFDAGLGRLEPGCPADLTILAYDPPAPLDEHNLLGHFIFGMSAACVRDTIVAGRDVLRDRKLVNLDEAELAAKSRAGASRLWKKMAAL